jgi:glycosyltransferase involved in cell wall biosynthesis
VIANSEKVLTAHENMGFRIQHSAVVHNGFDTDRFFFDAEGRRQTRRKWGVQGDQILVGLVGRVDPMKGQGVFMKVAASVRKQDTRLRFICVGPGSSQVKIRLSDLLHELDLGTSMIIANGEEDMKQAYSALDVIVSASVAEGFPNVIGEAMACGRACVVTDVGHAAELVGDTGILVSPNNDRDLALAVLRAVDQRGDLGARGRERVVRKFSIETMATRTKQALVAAVAR